jgi:predicted nucleotidyltransferase
MTTALMTEPVAAAVVALDEVDQARLSEIAQAADKPISTTQRAVETLIGAGVLLRPKKRGPVEFADAVPRRALRELAEWRLGPEATGNIVRFMRRNDAKTGFHRPPATVRNPEIRAAWPDAIGRIISNFHPRRIVLFGSQARGDGRPDSDVDLLMVFDDQVDRRETSVQAMRLLGDMPFAKDVLAASVQDHRRPLAGSILADAVRTGVTVYER